MSEKKPAVRKPKKDEIHHLVNAQRIERKMRRCIKCPRSFSSRCAGHRICGRCKRGLGDTRLPVVFSTELKEEE